MLERLAGREILGLTLGLDVAGDLEPRAAVLRLQDQWVDLISQLGAGGPAVLAHRGSALGGRNRWSRCSSACSRTPRARSIVLATMRPERAAFPAADVLSLERLADEEVTEARPRRRSRPHSSQAHWSWSPATRRETRSSSRKSSRTSSTEGCSSGRNGGWSLRDAAVDLGIRTPFRRTRRTHRPATGRGERGAPGRLGDRPLVHSGRPGRADRLERRGAHARGARLRPPHGTGARLRLRAHPRRRATAACRGRAARACTPPSRAGSRRTTRRTAAPACWHTTTRRRSPPPSRSLPGGTARKSLGSSRRRRCVGCWRAAELSLCALRSRRRPLAASPRRRARAGRGRGVACDRQSVNALKF